MLLDRLLWIQKELHVGFGGQIGLNYAANDTWNFAMRYDTKIKMEFEADTDSQELAINAGQLSFETRAWI